MPAITSAIRDSVNVPTRRSKRRHPRPRKPKTGETIPIALISPREGSPGTRVPHQLRFRASDTGRRHSGHRSCGLNPRRLYSQPGQKQSFEIAPLAVIGRLRCSRTSLRFCCAANAVTASVAREPDVYRDISNRSLGRGNQSNPAYIRPSCVRVTPSFQIFVMWRIRSPSNSMTYT